MDDPSLWNFNSGFLMNETSMNGASSQVPDFQFGNSEYTDNTQHPSAQIPPANARKQSPKIIDMRDIWFTRIQREDHLAIIPALPPRRNSMSMSVTSPSEPEIVDEDCRRELSRALTNPLPLEDFLPSSGFLVLKTLPKNFKHYANLYKNLSVRRYLKCFHPIFPIIHTASFQPTIQNGLLLISMASVGCLFIGSQDAVKRGRRIFEGLNKVILISVGETG